jgi:tetratricopeptide (TPR) repeat protein
LQALDGRGDLNGDGMITASELAAYVSPAVSALSEQTPAFGNLGGSEGGDFIFELKHDSEFLNSDSAQLGDDGIRLNAERVRLRAENLEKARQNKQLQQELAALKRGQTPANATATTPPTTAPALNDEGMLRYKEKNYKEAANKFIQASASDPASALFANNAGFALYKLQRYEDSIGWFKKAITLDSNRAVSYLNLGDAYGKLQRNSDAKQAYEKYLELAPASNSAAGVKLKVEALTP